MNADPPVSYLHYQVGVIYNCWIFSKLMVGNDVLHEPLYNQEAESSQLENTSVCHAKLSASRLNGGLNDLRVRRWRTFGYF